MTTAPPTAGKWTAPAGARPRREVHSGRPAQADVTGWSHSGPASAPAADRPLLGGDKHYARPDEFGCAVRGGLRALQARHRRGAKWDRVRSRRPGRPRVHRQPGGEPGQEERAGGGRSRLPSIVRAAIRSSATPSPSPRCRSATNGLTAASMSSPTTAAQFPYPRNPLGKGFAIDNVKGAIEGLELPNLEDPADPLTPARVACGHIQNWAKQPMPTGFGWYSKFWHPRAGWAGIFAGRPARRGNDAQSYAALLPPPARGLYEQHPLPTVDFRFFSGASPGLSVPYLNGDEAIRLTNLTRDGNGVFVLPGDRPAIGLDIGDGRKDAPRCCKL